MGPAIRFAAAFYQAIGFGRSVKDAFESGKLALMLEVYPKKKLRNYWCAKRRPDTIFLSQQGKGSKEQLLEGLMA